MQSSRRVCALIGNKINFVTKHAEIRALWSLTKLHDRVMHDAVAITAERKEEQDRRRRGREDGGWVGLVWEG